MNPYRVLGVVPSATAEEIRHVYKAQARANHPDLHPGDEAAEARFKEISIAYELLSDVNKRSQYDRTGSTTPTILTSRSASYEVHRLMFTGDVADLYRGVCVKNRRQVVLKISRSPKDNDLLENEYRVLKEIYPPDQEEVDRFRYYQKLHDSFLVETEGVHRRVNVLVWYDNFYSLLEVRKAFFGKLPMEHGVWMFNRVLEGLDFLHREKKIVHGAVTPAHILVYVSDHKIDPWNHGAKLIGWSAAVPQGKSLRLFSPACQAIYPPEVFAKKPVTFATDIFMAARSILYVLGANMDGSQIPNHVPVYLASFLRSCTLTNPTMRPQDAGVLHREFAEHMKKYYGPKKYMRFDMPRRA